MKVKIFSTRADENFKAIRIGDETGKLSANEYLEHEIQKFLDENPKIQIKHIQFNTVAIVPKTAAWNSTKNLFFQKTIFMIIPFKLVITGKSTPKTDK